MLSSEQQLAYSLLHCIDQTPDSKLMHLWIFIHHNYVFICLITIMTQKNLLCVIQFQFLYVHFALHYSIQSITVMQSNNQPARCQHVPRPCHFVSKMSLIHKSFKNLPIFTLIQTHAWNIDKAAIIKRQLGNRFAVMKLKPSIWMIFHRSNSG